MAQKASDHPTSSELPAPSAQANVPPAAQAVTLQQLMRPIRVLPLHRVISLNDGFARTKDRLGGGDIAASDLTRHGRSGQLIVAARQLRRDGTEETFLLRPKFFQYFAIRRPVPAAEGERPSNVARVQNTHAQAPALSGSWYFFLSCRRFDRLYPAAVSSNVTVQTPAPSRHAGGREREYDHERLLREALIYTAAYGWPDHLDGDGGLFAKLALTIKKLPARNTLYEIFSPVVERIKAERAKLAKKPKKPIR